MPQLDAMLKALEERGARELRLAEGSRPSFLTGEGEKPVSRVNLDRARILTLVGELAGPRDAQNLGTGTSARFVYRHPDGPSFVCELSGNGDGLRARIYPDRAAPIPEANSAPTRSPVVTPTPAAPVVSPPRVAVAGTAAAAPAIGPRGTAAIDALLRHMVESGSSDLHLSAGEIPMLRLQGDMVRVEGAAPYTPRQTEEILSSLMPAKNRQQFEKTHDTDFAYEIPGVSRFRVNIFEDRKGVGGVFRTIPAKIPSPADLGLPKSVLDLCFLHKGLVLVTGPTGSGKSTTLAALIDHINNHRNDHIITIEDPIEFVHENKKCLVNQREVGVHTDGFKKALRAALREDPDIVLVGEMRDLETVAIALETAETGHLVFGTLHTSTAPSTVDRIIDQFPSDRQAQIRVMLSESLKGVISQTLVKTTQGGRTAAMEVLIGVPAVANLIREGKTFQIPSIMQTGKKFGMVQLNDALMTLVKQGIVSAQEAFAKSVDRTGLSSQLRAAGKPVHGITDPAPPKTS